MKKEFIYIAADHAGKKTKEEIKKYLEKKNYDFEDLGTFDEKKSVDYPDYANKVTKKILENKNTKGILICGTGTGMAIAANRKKGIRATNAYDNYSAKMSRSDNNTNILCLRGRRFSQKKNVEITNTWLKTPFSKKTRHKKRIKKLG